MSSVSNGEDAHSELAELRGFYRAVDRWLAESDEARQGDNRHVHVIAPLDSAERVVACASAVLGQKFPHLKHPGITLNCLGCGRSVTLPSAGDGQVYVAPIDGWTAPPLLCPRCSEDGKRTGADGPAIGGPT